MDDIDRARARERKMTPVLEEANTALETNNAVLERGEASRKLSMRRAQRSLAKTIEAL